MKRSPRSRYLAFLLESLESRELLSVTGTAPAPLASYINAPLLAAPSPWVDADIGGPAMAGSSSYASGTNTWTVSGGGADITGTSDQFHFVYQSSAISGDLIARVTGIQNSKSTNISKAGIMFRGSTAANSAYVDILATPSQGVIFSWRSADGTTTGNATASGIGLPVLLKLTRNILGSYTSSTTGFYSTDNGVSWIQLGGAITANIGTSALAGLAVTAFDNSALATSTFTNVALPVQLSQIAFSTSAQSFTAGTTSAIITLQLKDSAGNPINAPTGGQLINLTSNSAAGSFVDLSNNPISSVIIPAGGNSISFKYKDTLAGGPTITAASSGLNSGTQQQTVTAAAPTQLAFTTAPQTIAINTASAPITLQLKDQYGNIAVAPVGGQLIALSSSAGTGIFLSGATPITSITLAAGSNSASFTYKDSATGSPTLTATSSGLTTAAQQETIATAVATKLVFTTSPPSATVNTSTPTITVQLQDNSSTPASAGSGGVVVTLTSSAGTGAFYNGAAVITTITIPQGANSASFTYKDTAAGTPLLTATASGLTAASETAHINAVGAVLVLFTTNAQTIAAGTTSSPITIALQDANGGAIVAGVQGQLVALSTSSSHGQFLDLSNATITSILIPAGSSSATFKYNDTVAGAPVLTASAATFSPGQQSETITPLAPAQLAFTSASSGILQNQPSVNLVVQLQDVYGNPAPALAATTLTFSTTSPGGSVLNTSNATITSIVVATGNSTATIRYKDNTVGTPTLTVLSSGLTSAIQAETVYASTTSTVTPDPSGLGSYASTPPGGANSTLVYGTQYDWINRPANSPLPTNDWWTLILSSGFAGSLYPLPQKLFTAAAGVTVSGFTGIQSASGNIGYAGEQTVIVGGGAFTRDALVIYGDWSVTFRMEQSVTQYMDVTTVQGVPMSWYQFSNIAPTLTLGAAGTYGNILDASGASLGNGSAAFTTDHFRFTKGGVTFAVFAPPGTVFVPGTNGFNVAFAGADHYLVVATLPDNTNATFDTFYQHAYALPTNTTYTYRVNTPGAALTTDWAITTTPLKAGASPAILQGWLPTNYRDIVSGPTLLSGFSYPTIYGPVLVSLGNAFTIVQPTNSLAFDLPAPQSIGGSGDFNPATMASYLSNYQLSNGGDSYGGMTPLAAVAQLTLDAQQLGDPNYGRLLNILRDAVTNWLSYPTLPNDPYGFNFYFTYYPPDHALIAYPPAFGSEHYTDVHFHYGYLTSAAAVLAMLDPTWAAQYGAMATLVAKSYANWDRTDTSEPFFRTFNIWSGHSYADGLGDSLGNQGNDQESVSEAIQSWQGLILLGQALNNQAMTDAGIMGYTMEVKAEQEYWLNVAHQDLNPPSFPAHTNTAINADFTREHQTFFGGSPKFILGIVGLPDWPSMDFLGRYNAPMQAVIDTAITSLGGWSQVDPAALQDGNNWLGVLLGMQGQVNPQKAADQFAIESSLNSYDAGLATTGVPYYITYSNRTYGARNFSQHLSLPVGGVYTSASNVNTYVVYNPATSAQTVNVYDANNNILYSFLAAARSVTVKTQSPNQAPTVATNAYATPGTVTGTTSNLQVLGADDGGESNLIYTWSVFSKPAGAADPTFTSNGTNLSKSTTAAFTQNGSYTLRATIQDVPGLTVTTDVVLNVTFGFAGITLDSGGAYIINLISPGVYTLHVTAGIVNFASDLGSANTVNLDVQAGAQANLNSAQHLAAITIANGATVTLAAGGATNLVAQTLALTGTGKLNLIDNSVLLTASSSATLAGFLFAGQIYSSRANDGNHPFRAVGLLTGSDFLAFNGPLAFGGVQNVQPTDQLLRYTWKGDATLDGKITIDDYLQIDYGFRTQRTGWVNGDFNYDGTVNEFDYQAIDGAQSQPGPLG